MEERIRELKDRTTDFMKLGAKRKKKSEDSLRDLQDTIKCINICIMGGEGREGTKRLFNK